MTEKEVTDGAEFKPYPTHSGAVLRSMKALDLNDSHVEGISVPIPVDGDALARDAYREQRLARAWVQLNADAIARLEANHGEIDRTGR